MSDDAGSDSWLGWFARGISEPWKHVIRPERHEYAVAELGPSKFCIKGLKFRREDIKLNSLRGHSLQCSHYIPVPAPEQAMPCVVFLHGISSSRVDALDILPIILPRKITVFCFDFSGSGHSEGDYVSMGLEEQKDLVVVLRHLRKLGTVSSIGLWGHSMGAATAILRAARDHCLGAVVLDSPFADLRTVAEELVKSKLPVPQFAIDLGIDSIRGEVKNRAGFDLEEVSPINVAPKARCPAFFGAARDDLLVLPHHARDLYDAWGGERSFRLFDGDHNDPRPDSFMDEAGDFLQEHLHSRADGMMGVPLHKQAVSQELESKCKEHVRMLDQGSEAPVHPTPML